MTDHAYAVGQSVNLSAHPVTNLRASAVYKIVAILPPLGAEFQYRLRCADEIHDRVVAERQIARVLAPDESESAFGERQLDSA